MTPTRSVEYDAFGPWILPVRALDDVPRAFRDYPFHFATAEFLLKVPRDIARRDATPDMHLYDRMLVVDTSGLTVLARVDDGFETIHIESGTIGAIENSVELLDGLFSVYGVDETRVEVPYNGSSRGVIATVANRLLGLATATAAGPTSTPTVTPRPAEHLDINALGPNDIGLVNAYLDAGVSIPGLRILAAYPGGSPASRESFIRRALKGRMRLSGAVIADTDSLLVVLSRRDWLRYRGRPDLSTKQTAIVRARVTGVEASPHPVAQDVTTVTVTFDAGTVEFAVPADGDAVRVLKRR